MVRLMNPDNRLFKEFLYFYTEFHKYLTSICNKEAQIGTTMVLFMANFISRQLETNTTLTKKQLYNNLVIPHASFYRLLKKAISYELIEDHGDKYAFVKVLPPHLRMADMMHKQPIFAGV